MTDPKGRPRGTVGKASASETRGSGFEPPWLVQRLRWESRPFSLVKNGAGAVTLLIDREGTVFPGAIGRFFDKRVSISHPFAVSAKKDSVCFTNPNKVRPRPRTGAMLCGICSHWNLPVYVSAHGRIRPSGAPPHSTASESMLGMRSAAFLIFRTPVT